MGVNSWFVTYKEQFIDALHRRKEVVPKQSELSRCLNAFELVSFGVGAIIGITD
jgi:hypothetical protein